MSATENFTELCRTCAVMTHNCSRHYIFEGEGILNNIPLKLKCLPISVTPNDHLPKLMCNECVYKLDMVYEFIEKTRRAELHLNELLHYQATIIKVEPDICAYSHDTDNDQQQSDCHLICEQTQSNHVLNFKEESLESAYGAHFLDSQCPKPAMHSTPFQTSINSYSAPVVSLTAATVTLQADPEKLPPTKTTLQSPVYDVEPPTVPPGATDNSITLNESPMFYLCRFCKHSFSSHDAANTHITQVHKREQHEKSTTQQLSCHTFQAHNLVEPVDSSITHKIPATEVEEISNQIAVDNNKPSTSKAERRNRTKADYLPPFHACTSCYIVFPSSEALSIHMQNHTPVAECKVCDVRFHTEEHLKSHMQKSEHTFSPQENKAWRCSECGKECRKKCKIQNHMRVHTGERPFHCNFCPKAFPIKAQLTMHERKHKNDWCYICNYCGKGFYVKVYFDNHVRTSHTKEKPFKCDKCDACYASKASLKEHILSKHNDGSMPIRIYECKICGKKFKDNNSLYYHNKTHAATLEERRKHKCLVCGVSFVKNHYLRKHMKIHTGENIEKFECHLCGKKLATSHGLELHLVIHSGVKNFICDFCGKAFASESTLKTHIRCHTGEKPYQCRVCSNFFTQRSSLLSHMKNIHNIDDRIRKLKSNS